MNDTRVAVVGLGYVGLTLAVTLAKIGLEVYGCEKDPERADALKRGQSPFFEPGVEEALAQYVGRNLWVGTSMPTEPVDTAIICVSTPTGANGAPDLANLRDATETVAQAIPDGASVIIRSTVPVGTTRNLVLPLLNQWHRNPSLAFCPERTIQGRALQELTELPQVVGGLDEPSASRAVDFWQGVTKHVVRVSSLESAEMVKLINNCHTDLLYAFGNEIALMAQQWSLDPLELLKATNQDYPRPDLARPGFVGGPCLTKDPYLLLHSFDQGGYHPGLVAQARGLNESLPGRVASHFVQRLLEVVQGDLAGTKVMVCGFAYKGWPATDDMRGSSIGPMLEVLRPHELDLWGHDSLVPPEVITGLGVRPASVEEGLAGARAALFINEHPVYRQLAPVDLVRPLAKPALLYDCWRMFDADAVRSASSDVSYAGIGYG